MGGGGVDIPMRNISNEWPSIKNLYRGQQNQYGKWWRKDPILSQLYGDVTSDLFGQLAPGSTDLLRRTLDSPILDELQKQGLDLLKGGGSDVLKWLQGPGAAQLEAGPSPLLKQLTDRASSELAAGGKLSPEAIRELSQSTLSQFAGRGNVFNQAAAADVLNRETLSRQRLREAEQFAGGVEQLGGSDQARRFGLLSGIEQLAGSDLARRFGLSTGALGTMAGIGGDILTKAIGLPSSVVSTGVDTFSKLTNPILAYASDLFSSNQNAAAASSIAGANKSGGALGGGLSSLGSILGSVIPIVAASDEDLKINIEYTGEKTGQGIPIARWQYKGDDRWFEGPIAQDVAEIASEAVRRSPITGHLFVDLSRIDAPFREIKPAKARVIESPLLTPIAA